MTTIYTGGPIYPDADGQSVGALAVRQGHVLFAGPLDQVRQAAGFGAHIYDLNGATVLPGLTDAHVHVWKIGQLQSTVLDLRGLDLDTVVQKVRERHAELPKGAWLWGRGWNETRLRATIDRRLIDSLAPGRPVVLTRTCAHIHAVSTAALQVAHIYPDTPAPPGGEIDYEKGRLAETAYGLVTRAMPAPTQAQYEAWILAGLHYLRQQGLTAVTDPAVDASLYEAYRSLHAAGRLPIRVNLLYIRRPDGGAQTLPLPEQCNTPYLRCQGVKFFCDGGLSGATAAISQPYRNVVPISQGILRFDTEDLYCLAREAHEAGFQLAGHAIGDLALDQLLAVYARLFRECPTGFTSHLRPRIEHFSLPSAKHLSLAHSLGVIAVLQPIFLRELRANYQRFLPARLSRRLSPLRDYFNAGLDVAFSSDGPVVCNVNPFAGVCAAVAEPYVPRSAVTVTQALRAYTRGGAVAHGDEHVRGALWPGSFADLTLLDGDPFQTDPQQLCNISIRDTIVAESGPL